MKNQTKAVKRLKGKIASMIKLCKLGIKKYIISLIDLEQELECAMSAQLPRFIQAMTWTITAQTRRQEGKLWLSRLDGICPKFGFKRTFLSATTIEWGKYGMKVAKFTIEEPGYYQDVEGDYISVYVEDGALAYRDCSKLEIQAWFGTVKV